MSETLSTIFVTDVPFWEEKTGAHLRISQIVSQLNQDSFKSKVLISQLGQGVNLETIRSQLPYPILHLDPSKPPETNLRHKSKWLIQAVASQMGLSKDSAHDPTFLQYYPQAIVDRFVIDIQNESPDIIVFEYVNQIQLLRALPIRFRQKTVCALDTHDVLWRRADQFRRNEQTHWIDATRADEEKALKEFDLIIAIQANEAEYFSSVTDSQKVIVTAMEFDDPIDANSAKDENEICLGLLSSNNWTNEETVCQILDLWPCIVERHSQLKFLLAGSICESKKVRSMAAHAERFLLLGQIESRTEFYNRVDAVWNPVRFGTGLKIKNLEALSFAKCLITSPHGAEGMGTDLKPSLNPAEQPFAILDSTEEIISFFSGLNQDIIETFRHNGVKHLKSQFGAGTQYPELRRKLASLYLSKSS